MVKKQLQSRRQHTTALALHQPRSPRHASSLTCRLSWAVPRKQAGMPLAFRAITCKQAGRRSWCDVWATCSVSRQPGRRMQCRCQVPHS